MRPPGPIERKVLRQRSAPTGLIPPVPPLRTPEEELRPQTAPSVSNLRPRPPRPPEGPAWRRPARAFPAERELPTRREPGLAKPTAKAGLALAAVTAATALIGAALGLPMPLLSQEKGDALSKAGVSPFAVGTAADVSAGPFHPVIGPVDYGEADARYGADRGGRRHDGQDMFAPSGTPLVAVRAGLIVAKGNDGGRGNYIAVYSPVDERSYVYYHMVSPSPRKFGDRVEAGELVGLMGCTGSCFGTHLHFEIHRGRFKRTYTPPSLDPLPLLRRWDGAPRDLLPADLVARVEEREQAIRKARAAAALARAAQPGSAGA